MNPNTLSINTSIIHVTIIFLHVPHITLGYGIIFGFVHGLHATYCIQDP